MSFTTGTRFNQLVTLLNEFPANLCTGDMVSNIPTILEAVVMKNTTLIFLAVKY